MVVDEAHCVLDWGYTFRGAYLGVKNFINRLPSRPGVAAFTATAPEEYRESICKLLDMKKAKIYTSSLVRSNIILMKKDCSDYSFKEQLICVKSYIKKYMQDGRVIVYCGTHRNVDLISNYLLKKYPSNVAKCHADMDLEDRYEQEIRFINGKKHIMVATTAFGMGIDIPDIRLVIHFNLPLSVIDYYQQVGRAGRDGEKSHAVLLYNHNDIELNRYILTHNGLSEDVQGWLYERLDEMVSIAESQNCLMQQVLKALSEDHPSVCRHCSNCQKKRKGTS